MNFFSIYKYLRPDVAIFWYLCLKDKSKAASSFFGEGLFGGLIESWRLLPGAKSRPGLLPGLALACWRELGLPLLHDGRLAPPFLASF